MSNVENNVTEIPTPATESADEVVTLTFNKKKIAKIAAYSSAAAVAVAGAVVFWKKAEENVTIEPLDDEDGFKVYETPDQD